MASNKIYIYKIRTDIIDIDDITYLNLEHRVLATFLSKRSFFKYFAFAAMSDGSKESSLASVFSRILK